MSTAIQTYLARASTAHKATFPESQAKLALLPAKKYILLTCIDARIDTSAAFGIQPGDAHVIRNAGGAAKDALRSIVISQQFLGTTEIMVVKHTKCGMTGLTNDKAWEVIEASLGSGAVAELKSGKPTDFTGFVDVRAAVKEDVSFLSQSAAVNPSTVISGWVYNVETGETSQVV